MKHLLEKIRGSRAAVIGLVAFLGVVAFAPIALSQAGPANLAGLTVAGLDDADDCKKGGWSTYNVFKNQGDCVSYVVTGGRNLPSGTTSSTTTITTPTTTTTTTATPGLAGLTSKDQCKKGGWENFGVFKNQGDCVSYVATGGSNPPDGA